MIFRQSSHLASAFFFPLAPGLRENRVKCRAQNAWRKEPRLNNRDVSRPYSLWKGPNQVHTISWFTVTNSMSGSLGEVNVTLQNLRLFGETSSVIMGNFSRAFPLASSPLLSSGWWEKERSGNEWKTDWDRKHQLDPRIHAFAPCLATGTMRTHRASLGGLSHLQRGNVFSSGWWFMASVNSAILL